MSNFNRAYEMMDNIYTLCKKGYTVVRMCHSEIDVFGILNDNNQIVITITEKESKKPLDKDPWS